MYIYYSVKLVQDQQAALKKAESSIDEYFAASQPAAMAESIEGGDVVTMARRAAARALGAADSRCDPGLQELEDVGAVVLRGFFGASAPAEEVAAHVKKCYDDIFPPILKQDPLIDTRTPTRTGVRLCPPVEVANMAEFSDNGEGPSAIEALNGQLASLGEDITKDIKIRNDNVRHNCLNVASLLLLFLNCLIPIYVSATKLFSKHSHAAFERNASRYTAR